MYASDEHYRLLGVRPGCSPEELKTAFRAQIKVYHPDRATTPEAAETGRRIIEAYHAILSGKEAAPQPQAHPGQGARPGAQRGPQTWAHQAGREYARRMFEQVFQSKFEQVFGRRSDFGMQWENFQADFTQQSSDERRATGPDFRRHEPPHSRPQPPASEHMERAEAALRDTVHRFQNRGQRSKREWCRDYLSNLARVQILFRDIIVREPQYEAVARQRLNQVRELMGVIRAMV